MKKLNINSKTSNLLHHTCLPVAGVVLAISMMCSACQKNVPSETGGGNPDGSIAFFGSIQDSKVTGLTWETGDKIGVFMQKAGVSLDTSYKYKIENKSYNISTDGVMSPTDSQKLYFTPLNDGLDFYAYYPYDATKVSHGIYHVDLTLQNNSAYRPIMWAKVNNVKSGDVPFQFNHKLARIQLRLTPGRQEVANLSGMQIMLNGEYASANLNLQTGVLTKESKADIPLTANVATDGLSAQVTVYVIPSSAATTRSFKIVVGTKSFVWDVSDAIEWKAGNTYIYNVRVGIPIYS